MRAQLRPLTKILLLVSRITANFLFAKIYRPLTINWANLADRAYTTKATFGLQATWIDAGFQGRWPEFITVVRDKLEAAAREGVRRHCWSPRADPERFRARRRCRCSRKSALKTVTKA